MAFGLYCLALNPDVQTKVREEVDFVLKKHGEITFDGIQEMTYLDMALSGKIVIQSSKLQFFRLIYNIILK
jgi:hypothetical protein